LLGSVRVDFPNHLPPAQFPHHQFTGANEVQAIWDTGAMMSSTPESGANLYNPKQVLNTFVKGLHGHSKPILLSGTMKPKGWANHTELPVFHIPGSRYTILSLSQISRLLNAHSYCNEHEAFLWTKEGVLAHAKVVDGLYVQQTTLAGITTEYVINTIASSLPLAPYVKAPATHSILLSTSQSLETLRQIHDASNHTAFSTLRKLFHYPPAALDNPDPLCNSCLCAEMKHDNIATDSANAPSRPWQDLCGDISRKKVSDRRGHQREVVVGCRRTDSWVPLFMRRKSDAVAKIDELITRLNNNNAPFRVASFKTDGDKCLNSEKFKQMLAKHGVHLYLSAPDEQRANPAESIMHRHGNACKSTMFRGNAPPSSWSLTSSHVARVHNAMPRLKRESPDQEATGIKPTWDATTAPPLYCKCWARLYNRGKEERHSCECIFLGVDYHCNAAIVRPINGRLASQTDRYSKVTRYARENFPYCHPNVARPHEPVTLMYASDTDGEDDVPAAAAPSVIPPILAHDLNRDFGNLVDYNALARAPPPDLQQDAGLPQVVRKSLREHVLSEKAINNIATLTSELIDNPVYVFDTLSSQYDTMPPDNPFSHLFDPKTDKMWEDPTTFSQMLKHPMKDHYLDAMLKERNAWERHKVLTIIPKTEIPINPKTGKRFTLMRNKPVWKTKLNPDQTIDKFKYRLTVNGMHQDKSTELCYESMVSLPSLRLFFDLVVRFGLIFKATDATEFYLNMDVRPGEQYYMEIPEGWTQYDRDLFCALLNKAVYGIPSATQTAGHALTKQLVLMGYTPCIHDNKFYVRWITDETVIFCIVHADDALWATNNSENLEADLDKLDKDFVKLTRRESPDIFRGIEIRVNDDESITLHQAAYLKELGDKYNLHLHKVPDTPASSSDKTEPSEIPIEIAASPKQVHEYMVRQGCLQWAVISSPSCAFRVNWLSRYMRNPQPHHVKEQLRCMVYMLSIASVGITFRRPKALPDKLIKGYLFDDLKGWADATWADRKCSPDSRSTTGFFFETSIGPLLFYTKKQDCVSNSTCESEIMSNRSSCMQGTWMRNLIMDLSFNFSQPTEIMQDNTGAIALCKTDAHHARSRHFRIACHYLKELYDRRVFRFTWVQSDRMKADILTKALPLKLHSQFERALTNSVAV
jgi:hypothetical protein